MRAVALWFPFLVMACAGATTAHDSSSAPSAPAAAGSPSTNPRSSAPKQVGDRAPPFSLDSSTTPGARVTLVPGKLNVVYFWATWNEPAKKLFPKLQEVYATYHAQGLEMAAISVDDEETECLETSSDALDCRRRGGNIVADAARDWGGRFPIAWDRGHKVAEAWKPSRMPTLYLVDGHGVIHRVLEGWHEGDEAIIGQAIRDLLQSAKN